MKQQASDVQPLPVQRAFVVQFDVQTVGGQGRWTGRVEHVVSGQATWFDTLADLLAFFTRILPPGPGAPPETP